MCTHGLLCSVYPGSSDGETGIIIESETLRTYASIKNVLMMNDDSPFTEGSISDLQESSHLSDVLSLPQL